MRASILTGVVLLFSVVGVPSAQADDLFPPSWRGQEGTTFAVWEFLTGEEYSSPDVIFNPYGDALAHVWPGSGAGYQPTWGGREGVWPLSGVIKIGIDNRPEPLPYKDIWVQITWTSEGPGGHPLVQEFLTGARAELVNQITLEPTGEQPPSGEYWIHSTYLIHLEPNPSYEIVRIHGKVLVDEVVVDTICAPEPGSMALLAIGGLITMRRRWCTSR